MKFIFLMTHVGSGSQHFCESLNKLPTICCNQTNRVYMHPTDLEQLKEKDRYAKTFIDTIEFNHSFASTAFYDFSKFIYLIRNPKQSLGKMIKEGYSRESAISYYLFRLRRLYEMAYKTPESLFLTYDNMFKDEGKKLIVDFLKVKELPTINFCEDETETWIPDKGYEKYLAMFRKLKVKQIINK